MTDPRRVQLDTPLFRHIYLSVSNLSLIISTCTNTLPTLVMRGYNAWLTDETGQKDRLAKNSLVREM